MSKARKRRRSTASQAPAATTKAPSATKKEAKRPTNLTLDPEAVRRGERFGRRHGASLSQLVTRFLYSLPADEVDDARSGLTLAVRRLYGLAAGGKTTRDTYREHLVHKYGAR